MIPPPRRRNRTDSSFPLAVWLKGFGTGPTSSHALRTRRSIVCQAMNSSAAADRRPLPSGANQAAVPVFGHTVERLKDLRHQASTSMAHLIQFVESDPSLTLNLFLTANEHLERANRPPAALIQHAILVLSVAAFNKRFTALPRLEAFSVGSVYPQSARRACGSGVESVRAGGCRRAFP